MHTNYYVIDKNGSAISKSSLATAKASRNLFALEEKVFQETKEGDYKTFVNTVYEYTFYQNNSTVDKIEIEDYYIEIKSFSSIPSNFNKELIYYKIYDKDLKTITELQHSGKSVEGISIAVKETLSIIKSNNKMTFKLFYENKKMKKEIENLKAQLNKISNRQ